MGEALYHWTKSSSVRNLMNKRRHCCIVLGADYRVFYHTITRHFKSKNIIIQRFSEFGTCLSQTKDCIRCSVPWVFKDRMNVSMDEICMIYLKIYQSNV